MGSIARTPAELLAASGIPDFESLPDKYNWPRENERGYRITEQLSGTERPIRIIHIGGGASGVCLAKFVSEKMANVTLTCYDKNEEVGGTWFENRYPGCACDLPSANYQFTWARNPRWSHFYSSASEILQYFVDIVDRFDLRKYMKLRHEIVGAEWDDEKGVWNVEVKDLETGSVFTDTAEVLINGAGILNKWKWPEIDGLHNFKGTLCHSAAYDTKTVLEGKRVAVLGTGSSGMQVTATIAPKVSKLYTWVRSPTWVLPPFAQSRAGEGGANMEYTEEQKQHFTEHLGDFVSYSKEMEDEINFHWRSILNGTPEAAAAKEFNTKQMQAKLRGKEELIDSLIPKTFGVGCRRPTPGNGFLEALLLPHTTTFTQEMSRVTETGFIDHEGREHEVDVIICATGFDTTFKPRFPVHARGVDVRELQAGKPHSYLSIGVPEIPNYWTMAGPYAPVAHGSFLPVIELIHNNILTIVKKMQRENIKSLAPRRKVCDAFVEHADLWLQRTAWTSGCQSWFKQGRHDGTLALFPGSNLLMYEALAEPRYEDYRIDYQSGNPFGYFGNGFTTREYLGGDLSFYLGSVDNPGALLPRP